MAAKKSSIPSPAQLREAFKTDLATCWQHARSLHPKETPYAFVLHGLEGTPHLYPYVLTEEGLSQVAKRYVAQGYHETVEEARKELRYSMEDSPYSTELEDKLPTVDRLMEPIEHTLDETEGYAMLAKAAMEAFLALDKQGTFGKGKQREKLLLLIETSLAEKDWSKPSVKRLNSAAAFRRHEAQTKVEGTFASANAITFSPDGRSLYLGASREIDPRKEKDLAEIVACDVAGLRLKRCWSLIHPRFGDSVRAMACASDGTLFVLRTKYVDEKSETVLMRFPRGDKAGLKQIQFESEASGFQVSASGDRVIVATFDRKLHFFDGNLSLVKTEKLKQRVSDFHLLKAGDILAATKKGIVRISRGPNLKSTVYRRDAFRLSVDADERLCAVSQWMKDGLLCDQKPRDQFGFHLCSLPDVKAQREIQIPGHQLVSATISPDGKLTACEAHLCGKYQSFIVVYETKTGREIARRKSNGFPQMAFLPGKNVLAITTSGYMKSEPVILWKVA